MLRRIGYERSISGLLSAALVVNEAHTMYSGRVKGYTLDPLLMFLLAMAVCTLAPRRWNTQLGIAWVVFAVVIGSSGGFLLVGSAAAAVDLVVFFAFADRLVHVGALVATGSDATGVRRGPTRNTTDVAGIDRFMEDVHNTHISISGNPVRLLDDLITHLRRIIEVYTGGHGISLRFWRGSPCSWSSVASLGRRPTGEGLTARLFLLILLIAYVGALLGKLPFGPTTESALVRRPPAPGTPCGSPPASPSASAH